MLSNESIHNLYANVERSPFAYIILEAYKVNKLTLSYFDYYLLELVKQVLTYFSGKWQ